MIVTIDSSTKSNPEITDSIINMNNLKIDENYFVQEGALDQIMDRVRSFGSQTDEIKSPRSTVTSIGVDSRKKIGTKHFLLF